MFSAFGIGTGTPRFGISVSDMLTYMSDILTYISDRFSDVQ